MEKMYEITEVSKAKTMYDPIYPTYFEARFKMRTKYPYIGIGDTKKEAIKKLHENVEFYERLHA